MTPAALPAIRISAVPWDGATSPSPSFGRRYLITDPAIQAARLSPPPTRLPLVHRDELSAAFEISLPTGTPDRDGEISLRVQLTDDRDRNHELEITLPADAPPQPSRDKDDAEGATEVSPEQLVAREIDAMLSRHIEGVGEILFPSRSDARTRPQRAEGLAIASWRDCRRAFWHVDDDRGPLRLIVRIAEDCLEVIDSIANRPRRILQRERRLQALDRIQQIDDACLRWLVRQPGDTVPEKGGPRQQVMGVVRHETVDTPENRVFRDFLVRCRRAAIAYLADPKARKASPRFQLVDRFRRHLTRLLRFSAVADIPRLTGIAASNYVLQFDERYSRIWHWYERLRRQQQDQDEMWRWQQRTWAEQASLAVLEGLSRVADGPQAVEGRLYFRGDQRFGRYIDSRSTFAPWFIPTDDGARLAYAFNQTQLHQAAAQAFPQLDGLVRAAPDLTLLLAEPWSETPIRALALFSALSGKEQPASDQMRLAHLAHEARGQETGRLSMPCAPLLILGSSSCTYSAPGLLIVPFDLRIALDSITGTVRRWLEG